MIKSLTFITGNPDKVKQLSRYLGLRVTHKRIDLTEIQDVDVSEVIKHKVIEAYKHVRKPVLVDDTSLTIEAMGKLPGAFIKYFLKEIGNNTICKIVKMLGNQNAVAEVVIGLYDGKNLKLFQGKINGMISHRARGKNGFGWDAIFIPEGYNQTRAEMSENDYDKTSPRKIALQNLEKYLNSQ